MPTASLAPFAIALFATLAVPLAARADDGPPGAAPDPATAPADDGPCAHGWAEGPYRRPRIAIGLAHSHLALDGDREGRQKSLLARVQFRRGFEVELELGKTELDSDEAKTIGGALLKSFGHRRIAPYVIAGGGGGVIERADGREDHLRYGEAGAGLMLRKRHFAFGVDLRAGVRRVEPSDAAVTARTAAPAPVPVDDDDHERYVRGRVLAMFYF